MQTALFNNTPTILVQDNRGQPVRQIQYLRHPNRPDTTEQLITRNQYNALSFLAHSIDPRLYQQQQTDETIKDNFSYLTSLSGEVLSVESVDAGRTITMNDIAQRPYFAVNATANRCHWQYEDNRSLGRLLSITEQKTTEEHITERFVWAGNSQTEKDWNLVGACVRHYDTAGLEQTDSIALTGAMLSTSRRLLSDDFAANWQGEDESAWDALLSPAVYTNHYTVDASGAILTSTDAMGNIQRQAYDVAGMLMASWLTLKNSSEQVIVKSLTYAANGQKLREEHGNGIVTSYIYEPQTQRLINIKTERPAGHLAGAKILQDLRYEYDPVGNVLRISNDAEATRFWRNQKIVPENHYYYDSLYRLVEATGREMANIGQQTPQLPPASPLDSHTYSNYTRSYTYDLGGNLSQIRHSAPASNNNYTVNITVSDRTNRAVLSTLTEDPSRVDDLFTAGGQQQQLLSGQALTWTPRGELLTVTLTGHSEQPADLEWYRYDANSQRVIKTTGRQNGNSSQTQQVIYLAGAELRTTSNDNGVKELLEITLMGAAGRAQVRALHWQIGKPVGINDDQLRYSYDDQQGSSRLEVDANGLLISQEEYYPYGGTSVLLAISQLEVNYKTIRYSGKELDATGLYYYGYRYYQPWVGRWLSADPAGTVDGLNLYRMCRNNPVTLVDEQGMAPSALQKSVDKNVKKAIKTIDKALGILQSDTEAVNQVMATFFGNTSSELKETWSRDLTAIQRMMKSFNVNENLLELNVSEKNVDTVAQTKYPFPNKKHFRDNEATSASEKEHYRAQVLETIPIVLADKKYLEVFKQKWYRTEEQTGKSTLIRTMIHEFSHIVIGTLDFAYGKVGIDNTNNLTPLYSLSMEKAIGQMALINHRFENYIVSTFGSLEGYSLEDYKELPYNNADSFAFATQLLAYSASKKSSRKEKFKSLVSRRFKK
ncbi:RHS repeat-associated core domain-containing protein [Arsenophonus apicola]|uniref:RHS repeat-associated core domain-containing protein n=1 Tax=Arsenophonus apicola TaxID=2879119 RepID=A0ABY8NZU5_9GAMM|nr:RHS repeat-associated core domain-containing protein [Arsenophonus apicola]WGO82758.1 RHS repeat-associated core domain-containing protein [Arsenophonus apicola]